MTTAPADTRPGLNLSHLDFLRRLIHVADQAGVTIRYCCYSASGWAVMTTPELDDAAGAAFLTALNVGAVGEPDQIEQSANRSIFAGRPRVRGGVRLYVRPIPADTEETQP